MPSCFSCGKDFVVVERVGRGESCTHCGADLHCCRNCEFYDPAAYNDCREPAAERVVEKDRSNFCDMFQIATQREKQKKVADDTKKKLEEMFKKRG